MPSRRSPRFPATTTHNALADLERVLSGIEQVKDPSTRRLLLRLIAARCRQLVDRAETLLEETPGQDGGR